MDEQIFIAREKQLAQLNSHLHQAASGSGSVCFISGEAGTGKTTLVNEFTKRAQLDEEQLAVALGLCDAQTGSGDAYFPFREVLGQLTGEMQPKLLQGSVNKENDSRLRSVLVMAGQAIVDVGPDLIGVFVPGIGLATKLGAFVAEKTGWLDKLEKLINKPKNTFGERDLDESHIFEQYTNVLCRISEKNPLIIILDDLHWADAASINLLFHLGRRIERQKILILGTYRSAEIRIGRNKERHPLEKALAEFKRYFGDIVIDLDQAVEAEGREFVEAYLNSEPNALSAAFVDRLYGHTDGHPLFTVELLRNMQENGDLIRDQNGCWVENEILRWEQMPSKVEGVIEERIGRLPAHLREIMTVGSVQGEDFAAEVVARVQQAEAREVISKLCNELQRQHRLVRAEGIIRLESAGQRLSQFRFQHNLFRTYLYNELSDAEKAYLHEDMGNALETCYGDQADEIAIDLALHFEIAGLDDKARYYLQKAGESSAFSYANEEAIDFFTRALALTPENEMGKRFELLMLREKVLSLKGSRQEQTTDLEQLENLAELIDDEKKRIEVALRQALFGYDTGDSNGAVLATKQAVQRAERIGENELQARGYFLWAKIEQVRSHFTSAIEKYEVALRLSQEYNFPEIQAGCFRGLGAIAGRKGNFKKAVDNYQKAISLSQMIGDRDGENQTKINLGLVLCSLGDFSSALENYQDALAFFRETGNRRSENSVLNNLGAAYANQGNFQLALPFFEESLKVSRMIGNLESEAITLDNLGNLTGMLGDLAKSEAYLKEALRINRQTGNQYNQLVNLHSLAILFHDKHEYSTAFDTLSTALDLADKLDAKPWQISIFIELGNLAICIGDYPAAEGHYESAYKIIQKINDQQRAPFVWEQRGYLYYHMKRYEESIRCCEKAVELAKVNGDQQTEAGATLYLANSLLSIGDLEGAKKALQCYTSIKQGMDSGSPMVDALEGLARIAWIDGNLEEALSYIKEILVEMETSGNASDEFPLPVLLTCYKILNANLDPQAEDILRKAHAILKQRANKITDEAMRSSYLENVRINHEIQEAYSTLV